MDRGEVGRPMTEIDMKDGFYIIRAPKCVLVLTSAQFIEALKPGKAWRREEAWQARVAAQEAAAGASAAGDQPQPAYT
jgi:hypothetical protein